MQNLKTEVETIQISMYTNIILNMLQKHNELSVNKTLLFSYLIKKEKFRLGKVYTAKNTQDVLCKAISLLSGEYVDYCENIKFILKTIHLLNTNNQIKMNGFLLSLMEGVSVKNSVYTESPFLEMAIESSKKVTDRQFMKEVTANV